MTATLPPADLAALRNHIVALTGIVSPAAVGIVGDSAHAATGGYHEGRTDLVRAGVWWTDYSVRSGRDRAGCTDSASAMDIGGDWTRGGRPAWLRFNRSLVADLRAGRPDLAAVRAVNYTPDGKTRLRVDRETGWRYEPSSDTVDVHTHIEWYRDTENTTGRALSCTWIALLIEAAIDNRPIDQEAELTPEEHDRLVNIDQTCNALIRMDNHAQLTVGNQANVLGDTLTVLSTNVTNLKLAVESLAQQISALASTIGHLPAVPDR